MAFVIITAPYHDLSITLGGARREIDSICSLPADSMEYYASSSKPYSDFYPDRLQYLINDSERWGHHASCLEHHRIEQLKAGACGYIEQMRHFCKSISAPDIQLCHCVTLSSNAPDHNCTVRHDGT
jgi:hypothetical protein